MTTRAWPSRCSTPFLALFALLAALHFPGPAIAQEGAATYRCWMFNVEGVGGGPCRPSTPIILYPDGTYKESSTRGTYTIKGDQIIFSKSTVRGPGRITDNKISFNYVYEGQRNSATFLLQSGTPPTKGAASGSARSSDAPSGNTSAAGESKKINVDVIVQFREGDGTMSWADTMILTRAGQRPEPGTKYYMKIAVQDRKNWRIHSSFNLVPTGYVYDVWTDSGLEKRRVGQIDLRSATQDVALTVEAVSSKSNPGSTLQRPQSHTPLPPASTWKRPTVDSTR